MSARGIVIADCGECPNRSHRGAYGRVAYLPVCIGAKEGGMHRELPHTQQPGDGRVYAKLEPGVPEWCPLPMVEVLP